MENLNPRKTRTGLKISLTILAVIIILIILLIICVPFYVSSNSGRQMVVDKVNSSTGGKLAIADLSMGWFSGINLKDVTYVDDKGAISAAVKNVYTQPNYRSIIFGDISLGQTVIDEPVIKVDLAKFEAEKAAKPKAPKAKEEKTQLPLSHIDLVINKGNFTVNDSSKTGQLVQLSDINTKLNLRPAGEKTTFNLNLVAADAAKSMPIQVNADITPSGQHGWQMVGTSGDIKIDANQLDLSSFAPLIAMADPNIKASGVISINGTASLDNGKIKQANMLISGHDLNISLPSLKGDSFNTKTLAITAEISTDEKITKIQKLDAKLDWANLSLKGVLPATAKSLDDFLSPQSPTELTGNLDVDLPPLLAQMPHTIGLKEGTKINSGKLKADISTAAETGRKVLQAKMVLSDLQGVVNGKNVALSKPIQLDGKLSGEKGIISIDQLAIDSSFAQAKVSGTNEAMKYNIDADLAKTQTELGQFVDFGKYKLAGQVNASGNVSMKAKAVASDGTMTINQLSVASDKAKATEPAANISYKINLDQTANVLDIDTFKAETSFAQINIAQAAVPLNPNSPKQMNLSISANADFSKAMPWMVLGGLSDKTQIAGNLNSTINITSKGNEYNVKTDSTKITDLAINTQNQPPFKQAQITLDADMFVNPVDKTYKIKTFKLSSPPAINIELLKFSQTNDANTTKLNGEIKADYDWKAVTAMAAPFMPAGLQLAGKRNDTITFSSQWPYGKTDQMLANMNAQAAIGWQTAEYMGFELGQTEIKADIKNGKLIIPPFTTTMNNGTLNFGASADFRQKPSLLKISQPMNILKDVQINDKVAAALLKNVNPIFASAKNTQGLANLECRELAIPLSGGTENDTRIDATISIMNLHLQSPVLEVIAVLVKRNLSSGMTLQPSQIVMNQGVLRYDKMELDLGDVPLIFSGQMGPGNKMNNSVTVSGLGAIAFKGTKDKPQLDPVKMAQLTLQQQLLGGTKQQTQPGQTQQPQASPEQQIQKGIEGLFKKKK